MIEELPDYPWYAYVSDPPPEECEDYVAGCA